MSQESVQRCRGQGIGIGIAEGLAGGIGRDRHGQRRDHKAGRGVGDVIVRQNNGRTGGRIDGIAADNLTCRTGEDPHHVIRWQESAERSGQNRIARSVDLAAGIRPYRRRFPVDRQRRGEERHRVVRACRQRARLQGICADIVSRHARQTACETVAID